MKRLFIPAVAALFVIACSGNEKKPVTTVDGNLQDGEVASEDSVLKQDLPPAGEVADIPVVPPDVVDETTPLPEVVAEVAIEVAPEVVPPVEIVEETTPDVPPPDGGCVDIWNCGLELNCFQKGDACWTVCMEGTSEFAQGEFKAFGDCVATNCSQLPEEDQGPCTWEKCSGEITVCLGGMGTADCGETFTCMADCPKDDGMCTFKCLENASQEAVEIALKLSQGEEPQQFYWLIECMGGQGEANCGDTVICLNGCNQDAEDPTCTFACIAATSEASKVQLQEMVDCGGSPCMDKMIACVGGGGDKTCGQVFQCVFDCEADNPEPAPGEEGPDCMTPCIAESSPKGAEDLAAMFTCMAEKCPNQAPGQDPCPESLTCFALCPDFPMPQ